jgi:DNA polymerase elongation subunit (family B)
MDILHIDIETAPIKGYFWDLRTNYIPKDHVVEAGYTMCYAYKWHGTSGVSFKSIWDDGYEEMVRHAHELLERADAVVHYNGMKFDIPVLNWEFAQVVGYPPTKFHHIDLYREVRKNFKIMSYKLDYVAQVLLGDRKVKHLGMDTWAASLAGDTKARKLMEKYNKKDVALLPKLYKKMLPWIKTHPNHALYTEQERPVCTNCGSTKVHKVGVEKLKTQQYQRYRCAVCKTPLRDTKRLPHSRDKKVLVTSR